jgi:hypothetical protein
MKSVTAPILISTKLKGGLTRVIAIACSGVVFSAIGKETEHRRASARANLHTRAIENDLCCSFATPVKISERIVTCVLDHICFHGLITLALVPYFYLIGSSLNYSRFEITFA